MRVYVLKWKNCVVGEILTNENGRLSYVPNIENINKLKDKGIPYFLIDSKDGNDLPEFVKRRLKLNSVMNSVTATDYFSIVRV